jgi:hypothetical protein
LRSSASYGPAATDFRQPAQVRASVPVDDDDGRGPPTRKLTGICRHQADRPCTRGRAASRATIDSTPLDKRSTHGRRVAIICQLDGFANGVKPVEIERFLRERGHEVRLVNTSYLGRASAAQGSVANRLPALTPRRLALYGVNGVYVLINRHWKLGRRHMSYYLLLAEQRLRRAILRSSLPLDDFDLVICETPYDAEVLRAPTRAGTLYDCPTPWADELYFEGRLTERQHVRMRRREKALLERVDQLAYWWQSYARYAVEHYGIHGRNLMRLDYGCTPAPSRAAFRDPPRIAYMGSLRPGAVFIDLPLLSRLSKLYPHIDVYGAPAPDPALGLNYLGYGQPSVLERYQLGLVTCTKDELRRNGFSAKHLQYLAYGLPVLVPAWRRHLDLLQGSVPYEEETFRSVIDTLSEPEEWGRVSDQAYAQAQRLSWDRTLQPLAGLLDGTASPRSPG